MDGWKKERVGTGRYHVRGISRDPILPVAVSYRLPGLVIGGRGRWAAELGGQTIGHYPTATAACRAIYEAAQR